MGREGRRAWSVSSAALLLALGVASGHADSLTTFEHHIVGVRLRAEPGELFVPKNIPGSIRVDIATGTGETHPSAAAIARGKHIRATLRGPAFPAYPLLGLPNEPLILPPLALVGDYEIDDISLVDTETGEVRATANPARIPVHVFPEVLVSQVVSRPLTLDEIKARNIAIDASNFSAVEFEVMFTVEGRAFPVLFPVITPKFKESTEIIPRAEIEEKLALAQALNDRLATEIPLPPELKLPGLNLQVKPINFEPGGGGESDDLVHGVPIPGLVVIPGSIGFLNRFFSVQVYTANAAPLQSSVEVHDLEAELLLPPGRDRVVGTADDPLAFARVGPDATLTAVVPIRGVGPDGLAATPDDAVRLRPGQTGQGEFLIEGKKEGLQTFDIRLRGTLDGFAAGELPIEGLVTGSVLIRNPKFSIVFSHPLNVRAEEPYVASVTVLNTAETPADLVSIHLTQASLSGVRFAAGQEETISIGTLDPGESATADFAMVSERTGFVTFSNLTGDEGTSGRFDLKMAVDERGLPVSAQVIQYPPWVSLLPPEIQKAADRVLGRALASASAAILPPGVRRVTVETVRARVIELAEAGQRLAYDDAADRIYPDLLLDWYGGRLPSLGFDQILRETPAGVAMRSALFGAIPEPAGAPSVAWLSERAPDLAGRGERWGFVVSEDAVTRVSIEQGGVPADLQTQGLAEAGAYGGTRGTVAFLREPQVRGGGLEAIVRVPALGASSSAAWLDLDGAGLARIVTWPVTADPARDTCYHYFPIDAPDVVTLDPGCANASSEQLAVSITSIAELPPEMLSASQDLSVFVERPYPFCGGPSFSYFGQPRPYQNYGSLLAVLFSKPMASAPLEADRAFRLDNGVETAGIKLQGGGRVALVNMRNAIAAWRPRQLEASPSITDVRGHALTSLVEPIEATADQGVSISGVVVGTTGEPVPSIPVTLTMNDLKATLLGCVGVDVRASQVLTGPDGRFTFDFAMSGIGYTLGATDVRGLSSEATALLLETATAGELDPAEIQHLATTPEGVERLLRAFGTGSTGEAIALADGVDRAVFRDFVELSSVRVGSDVPVALRFRGRGTVTGTVVLADGHTPVANAAVNLFPDSGSREKGRGVFTDGAGRFAFTGVPLGAFSIDAKTQDGRVRTVAGRLDAPGEHQAIAIVLSAIPVPVGELVGAVYEPDGTTPHPLAQVYIQDAGDLSVIAEQRADGEGRFDFPSLPAIGIRIAVFSSDGRRTAERRTVVQENTITSAYLSLPGTAVVVGRVELPNGAPAAGALVAGGERIEVTDASGLFTLTGVPTGRRTLAAGLEVDLSVGNPFVRLANTTLDVLPGVVNNAVIRFPSAGRIQGRVLDPAGQPVPFLRVMIPRPTGFLWTNADGGGRYSFGPLSLGDYRVTVAQPGLPVTESAGTDPALDLTSSEALQASLTAALSAFTSAGAPARPPPGQLGWADRTLSFDGEIVTADIQFLPNGVVSGHVENHLAVPIGAQVSLRGLLLDDRAQVIFDERSRLKSDPSTGGFSFSGLPVGPYTLIGTSPFYTVSASARGQTTLDQPSATGVVLTFPPPATSGARLTGLVSVDGAPAGAGVQVAIDYTSDYQVLTSADGTFDTQIDLPARSYGIRALDPATGRVGFAQVKLQAGITGFVEVPLLAVTGGLDIVVLTADRQPAASASVNVDRGSQPPVHLTLEADPSGRVSLSNLVEGSYSVTACKTVGQSRLCATRGAQIAPGQRASLELVLEASGTVAGTYVEADGTTPVGFAQVSIGRVAFAATDAAGNFSVPGIPLGTHTVTAHNAVTGRAATAEARVTAPDQVVRVFLREADLGVVRGSVLDADGITLLAAAPVTLTPEDALFASQTVTTDPSGGFSFPGIPPGAFTLRARHPSVNGLFGSAAGTMPVPPREVTQDVRLSPRASIVVTVLEAGGTPAAASVSLGSTALDTDMLGQATFSSIPLGTVTFTAHATTLGRTRSRGSTTVTLANPGQAPGATIQLRGVGVVTGTLFTSVGVPVPNAQVYLDTLAIPPDARVTDQDLALTDANGRFSFDNIAVAPIRARGVFGSLQAAATGTITHDGDIVDLALHLTPSADVSGWLVRADGVTRVPNADLAILYQAPSGLEGAVRARTSSTGAFVFAAIPEGTFEIRGTVPHLNGVLLYRSVIPPLAGTLDVGALGLDEAAPFVTSVVPADGAAGVLATSAVQITFSEAMDASFSDLRAAYLADPLGAHVPLEITWPSSNVLLLSPTAPLASTTPYTVVVVGAALRGADGAPIGPGPTDLAERVLDAPFYSHFTTIDSIPPLVVSFTPEDHAVQVDPSSVIRITFSKPIVPSSVQVSLTDSTGSPVPSAVATGLDDRLLVLTPTFGLLPNAHYVATLSAASDRVGNALPATPIIHGFDTLDTIGPAVVDISPVGVPQLVSGAMVPFQATLASPEAGVEIQGTLDLVRFVGSVPGDSTFVLTMPAPGPIAVFARAIDRFGNVGPFFQKSFEVFANQPPEINIAKITPAVGPLRTGQAFTIQVAAIDDSRVTQVSASAEGAGISQSVTSPLSTVQLSGVIPATVGPGSVLTVNAQAQDDSGLVTTATPAAFPIADGVAPTVALAGPAQAPRPGTTFTLTITADDAFGVADYSLTVSGAASFSQAQTIASAPEHAVINIDVPVPPTAQSGALIHAAVVVHDAAGNARAATLNLSVADLVSPTLVAVLPPSGKADVPVTQVVTAFFSEAVTGVDETSFQLSSNGVLVPATVELSLDHQSATLTPQSDLLPSTTYLVLLTAMISDLAQNPLAATQTTFRTKAEDVLGPRLVAVRPADTSTNVALSAAIELELDEPVTEASVSAADFVLEPALGGAPIATTLVFADGGRILRFRPPLQALQPGVAYRATLAGHPVDAAGNQALLANGDPWSPVTTLFTTASITIELATGAYPSPARAVEGHPLTVRLVAQTGATLERAAWFQDTQPLGTSYGTAPKWVVTPPSAGGGATVTFDLEADAYVAGAGKFAIGPTTVTVEPISGDFDSDGLTNGAEATAGTNPWVSDASADPDEDLLTNTQEVALGTDPQRGDTDGDGISDGSDPEPLHGKRAPGVFVATPAETRTALFFDGSGGQSFTAPVSAHQNAPITLELWANPNAPGDVWGSALDLAAINIGYDATSRFSFSVRVSGGVPVRVAAPFVSAVSTWHHLAVSYDGARARLFVDGLLAVDAPQSGVLDYASATFGVGSTYNGGIDEVRVWSYARTSAELGPAMHKKLGGEVPGLVASWPLEGATPADDATAHGHTAGVVNPIPGAGGPVYGDRSFQLTAATQALTLGSVDLDGDPVSLALTKLPLHGRLLGSGGVPITALGPIGAALTYEIDPSYIGSDEIEVVGSANGLISLPLAIQLASTGAKVWVGGNVTQPNAWSVASNWSPSGVPVSTDRVLIPAGAPQAVFLDTSTLIAGLYVGSGAVVTVAKNGATDTLLTVAGSVASDGGIEGDGVLVLSGAGSTVRGVFSNVRVTQSVLAAGALSIRGNLRIVTSGLLTVGGQTVAVDGALEMAAGRLGMTSNLDIVDVQGPISWTAASTSGSLTAGILRGHSAFSMHGNSTALFRASGTHRVELVGPTAEIHMDFAASNMNRFQDLTVLSPVLTLTAPEFPTAAEVWLFVAGDLHLGNGTLTTALTTSGELDVAGGVTVAAGSWLSCARLVAGHLEGTGGTLAPGTLVLEPSPATPFEWAPDPTHDALTHVELRGPVELASPLLVSGDLTLAPSGLLSPNGQSVSVGGALRMTGGGINMNLAGDLVDVQGLISFTASSLSGSFTAGVLRGHAAFRAAGNSTALFRATGAHRVELVGPTATIHMDSAAINMNRFQNLWVTSPLFVLEQPTFPAAAVVWLYATGDLSIGDGLHASGASLAGQVTVAQSVSVAAGASLSAATLVAGQVSSAGVLAPGTLVLQPAALFEWAPDPSHYVLSNLELRGPVRLLSSLLIGGDLTVASSGLLTVNNQGVSVGGALRMTGGGINMNLAGDLVDVQGLISFTAGSTSGSFTAGVLRGHAAFSAAGNSTALFRAAGTHRVELVGPTATIRMNWAASNMNRFQDLFIASPAATLDDPTFGTLALKALGTLTLSGTPSSIARLDIVAGQSAEVNALVLEPYSILNNQGTLTAASCTRDPTAVVTGVPLCP